MGRESPLFIRQELDSRATFLNFWKGLLSSPLEIVEIEIIELEIVEIVPTVH
jgi:hypothetical protein